MGEVQNLFQVQIYFLKSNSTTVTSLRRISRYFSLTIFIEQFLFKKLAGLLWNPGRVTVQTAVKRWFLSADPQTEFRLISCEIRGDKFAPKRGILRFNTIFTF
jgi:hypothetical protein